MANDTAKAESDEPDCRFCGEPVGPLEPGHYKIPGDKFAHAECVADDCYDSREKVATDEGVFRIKRVTITKTVGNKEEIIDSYWQAECPVCYRTHETDSPSEDVRTDLIDTVCGCCGAEWLPPSDWVEDCEICGTSHRESRDCKPLSMREPFPDPDEHRYECSECGWSGEGDEFGNPDGYCPECDSAAVRALKIATDGGATAGKSGRLLEDGERSRELATAEYLHTELEVALKGPDVVSDEYHERLVVSKLAQDSNSLHGWRKLQIPADNEALRQFISALVEASNKLSEIEKDRSPETVSE